MPIIIDRATGKLISAPQYTQEQRDKAWDVAIRHFLETHPEKLQELRKGT